MKLTDLKNRLAGKSSTADPARAFGAEQQTMEEIRRQTFQRPSPKPAAPNVAQVAGAVLSDLKSRLSASPAQPEHWEYEPPVPEAPTYVDNTYTPEPGWQNPFYAPTPSGRAPSMNYAPQPEYYPPYQSSPYSQPMYEQQVEYEPVYSQPAMNYAPFEAYAPQDAFCGEEIYGYPPQEQNAYAPPAYTTGEAYRPVRPVRQKQTMKPGELKYYLWSGSIVGGVLLTVIAFIYACAL